jgi:hypothetical protein
LITPSDTAFTRKPREAYSIASDLVTATRPPLVSNRQRGRSAVVRVLDERCRDIDHVATTPVEHVFDRSRRDVKKTGEVDGDQGVEVLEGVLREGLADV